jgi:hypothetical protein
MATTPITAFTASSLFEMIAEKQYIATIAKPKASSEKTAPKR